MGRLSDSKRPSWVAKAGGPAGDVCYDRYILLQLGLGVGKSSSSETPDSSPWSGPWSGGSLHCVPVDEISDGKTKPARQRAASEQIAMPSKPNTLVLKNFPLAYSRTALCEELARHGFGYAIDFLYLPIDASTGRNLGHVFVNVRTKDTSRSFIDIFQGIPASDCLPAFASSKVCQVSNAEVQGREANMKQLATTSNLAKWTNHEDWQPLFLDDYGERVPMSQWGDSDKQQEVHQRQCASAKNTPVLAPQPSPVLKPRSGSDLQATAPEFVPQMEVLCRTVAMSPNLRPEANEFVPTEHFSLDA